MKRRIACLLLVIVMVACMIPTVSAATYSGTCGAGLKWNLDTDTGVLKITGTGAMKDYGQNGEPWHSQNDCITSIVVEDGCTHIGNWAFGFCENLVSVSLPNSVTSIGSCAFYECAKMTTCPLPDYLTSIGERGFFRCRKMTGLDLPETLTSIGSSAFAACSSITVANIPGGVTKLFYGTFEGCSSMTALTLGEGVVSTEQNVFRDCKKLKSVTLPSSFISLGRETFVGCKGLESVIMLGCESIGQEAFGSCSSLKKVILSNNLSYIGFYAFQGCSALTSIHFPASLNEIDYNAFGGCSAMTAAVFYGDSATISNYAYLGQTGVNTIYCNTDSTAYNYAINKGYNVDTLENAPAEPSIFDDVASDAYYAKPIAWAVENGITNGYGSANTFCPEVTCNRAQVVTFLWRAAGKPEPTTSKNPFTDVKYDDYFYKAVLWAVEKGITTGYSATSFAPNETCTRGQVVTFLYRSAGSPAVSGSNPFADVASDSYYVNSIIWAVGMGITTGYSATSFGPDDACSRGQVVTFLYRA